MAIKARFVAAYIECIVARIVILACIVAMRRNAFSKTEHFQQISGNLASLNRCSPSQSHNRCYIIRCNILQKQKRTTIFAIEVYVRLLREPSSFVIVFFVVRLCKDISERYEIQIGISILTIINSWHDTKYDKPTP